MTAIPQFSASNAPFVEADGRLSFAANVWLRDLWLRVGGANAPSNTDLQAQEYADAGIEEAKAQLFAFQDAISKTPSLAFDASQLDPLSELSSLRAEVDALRNRLDALEQK